MATDEKSLSFPQSGMNRDTHASMLNEQQYTFALNANIESEDGNVNMRSNEHSTLKCIEFEGYKVIGYKNDLTSGNTYFFLTNPSNKTSKITYLRVLEDIENITEDQMESAISGNYQICSGMQTLIEDSEDDPCLNFSIYHPIKTIEIKAEKCGKCIYWTDGYNPPRYVIVEKALEPDDEKDIWYHYHGYKICDKGYDRDNFIKENGCVLACEKLRVFPELEQPDIEATEIAYGGSLRSGVYQFAVALCDEFGNEKTNYSDLTNPIHVFDKQYIRIKDGKWGERTNLGIRLVVNNLDRQVNFFKIAVIQNTVGYNGETQPVVDYFIEGIHPVTEKTIYYYSDLNNSRTTFEHIAYKKPIYNTSKGIVAVSNKLLHYGLTAEKEWNLQPVVSLMGHFLKWQSSVAHEDLYKDGVACSLYVGYMRDEVYPFSISFKTNTGYKTPVFTFIPPPYKESRSLAENDPTIAVPYDSVKRYSTNCYENERKYIWQYINTAKELGDLSGTIDCASKSNISTYVSEGCNNPTTIGQTMIEESDFITLGPIHFVAEDINVTNIPLYISENMQNIACANSDGNAVMAQICELYNNYNKYNSEHNDDALESIDKIAYPNFPETCGGVKRQESILSVPFDKIININAKYLYKDISDMLPSSTSYIYGVGSESGDKYSILFDYQSLLDMTEYVRDVYEEPMGKDLNVECALCDDALVRRRPESMLAAVSSSMKIMEIDTCSCGCSMNSQCVDPIIYADSYTVFQNNTMLINGRTSLGNVWCTGKHGSGTGTMIKECYHSRNVPSQLHEEYWSDIESKKLKDYVYEKFDTSISTEWEWTSFPDTASSDSTLPDMLGDGRTNGQFHTGVGLWKFQRYLGKNARWIKINRPERWKEDDSIPLYLELFGKDNTALDPVSSKYVRISFWKDLNGSKLNLSDSILSEGSEQKSSNSRVFLATNHLFEKIDKSFFDNNNIDAFYITIDTPLVGTTWSLSFYEDKYCGGDCSDTLSDDRSNAVMGISYLLSKTMQPYVVGIREPEVSSLEVDADALSIRATVTFVAQCESCGDKPINCAPRPYKYGDFAYWESSEKYPANFELYDSSRVKINVNKSYDGTKQSAYSSIISKMQEYYGSPINAGNGLVYFKGHTYGDNSTSTTFCQQPIRHYKFPDNFHSPFMNSDIRSFNVNSEIYPIGILIDEDVIQVFLDFAVDSGLISQKQRDSIVGYEIYRGDRRLNRSIVAAGMSYDMYKYKGLEGNINLYSNYPYNDLSVDQYNYADEQRTSYIEHPFPIKGNVWYTFHSPDIHFNKPELPSEVIIDGYQRGMSVGNFAQVEDHPKWVILGPKAYKMANTLANIESWAAVMSTIMQEISTRVQSIVGIATSMSIALVWAMCGEAIAKALGSRPLYYGKYRYDWLNTFINNGPRRNYAWYYTSIGLYNSMMTPTDEAVYRKNFLRGLSTVMEIKSGIYPITDESSQSSYVTGDNDSTNGNMLYVNSIDRESSIFLSFGNPGDKTGFGFESKYLLEYPLNVANYDTSRIDDPLKYGNDSIAGKTFELTKISSFIASPYMKLKKYKPDQYGQIEDIKWVSIGGSNDFSKKSGCNRLIFGGDIFLSRFSLKRKFPIFYNNCFGIGDMIPFPYDDYRNVGYPKFFVNYDTGEDALEHTDNERFNQFVSSEKGLYTFYPNRYSLYNLNGYSGDKYVQGCFYLWFYGIPQFLVESETNCNFRLEGTTPDEWFYPAVGDFLWWTQEKNVSIQKDNDYKISPIYFSRSTLVPNFLPSTYERKFWDCAYQRPNGVIWSISDVSENSQTDPWLTYKPVDYHEFPTKNGSLIHMKRIESNQILARFEDQVSLHNAIDVIKERVSGTASELGTGGLFSSRPLEYNTTDLGYAGTQSTEIISSEFGHFWVDVKRAQVFMTDPNGRNLKELSVGIRHWLKKHLPFKILKYGITNVDTKENMTYEDVDNKFIGLGLSLGWDNRYKRVFITKKDYIPAKSSMYYKYDGGRFFYDNKEVSLKDENYFKDVSFTLAYSCIKQEWISYYSFCPDYYIEQQSFFQSGNNYSKEYIEEGLWSHLMTNKSFQTFYGTTYPFILEVPVKEKFNGSILSSIEYELDARKYVDDVTYTLDRKVGLDSITVYNDTNNSGEMHLVPEEKNNMMQKAMYPITRDGYTEILDTEVYRRHKLNDFFNRVDDDRSDIPIWDKDDNDIIKEVNKDALNFRQNWLDRIRGSWLLMRIKKVISNRKIIFQWIISENKPDNR